jgi:putative heme transporter
VQNQLTGSCRQRQVSPKLQQVTTPERTDRTAAIGRGLLVIQRWGILTIVVSAALFCLGWAIGRTWDVWFPVAIALIIATVLAPPVGWIERHKVPRGISALLVMLAFLAGIFVLIALIIPALVSQTPEILNGLVSALNEVETWLSKGPLHISDSQINEAITQAQSWLRNAAVDIGTGALSTIASATGAIINTFMILMLTFLFIKDGNRFLPWVARVGGERAGTHIAEVVGRSWGTLGAFIRTQALVALIDAFFIGLGIFLVGNPLWLPLAIVTFLGGFIPIVGAFVSGTVSVLITLVTNGFTDALIVLGIVLAVQQLEGNVLSPMLQSRSVKLHPAIVLLAVLGAGSIFGITGAFLAVPVVAALKEMFAYLDEQITISTREDGTGSELATPPDTPSSD